MTRCWKSSRTKRAGSRQTAGGFDLGVGERWDRDRACGEQRRSSGSLRLLAGPPTVSEGSWEECRKESREIWDGWSRSRARIRVSGVGADPRVEGALGVGDAPIFMREVGESPTVGFVIQGSHGSTNKAQRFDGSHRRPGCSWTDWGLRRRVLSGGIPVAFAVSCPARDGLQRVPPVLSCIALLALWDRLWHWTEGRAATFPGFTGTTTESSGRPCHVEAMPGPTLARSLDEASGGTHGGRSHCPKPAGGWDAV